MITEERIQEIKNGLGMVREFEPVTSTEIAIGFCRELIAALEAANDNAATWQNTAEELGRQLKVAQVELDVSQAKLAEVQTEIERLRKVSEEFKEYMPFLASHGYFETTDTRLDK